MLCVLNIFYFISDVAPEWSGWSTWSGCTVLCGGGRQTRVRSCLNGNICEGEGQEYQDCNLQECPNCEPNVIHKLYQEFTIKNKKNINKFAPFEFTSCSFYI